MKPFVFRPSAALDLRRREHDAAAAQLARAQRERDAAAAALEGAEAAIVRGGEELRREQARCGELARVVTHDALMRHRTWIVALRVPADRCRRALHERKLAVETATRNQQFARRRMRALERLRDRALRSYEVERRRTENVAM